MDKIKFATLISYITFVINRGLNEAEIEDIDSLVKPNFNDRLIVNKESIDNLLSAMQENKKIDAIRAYHVLTDAGLKESKDAVEKYLPPVFIPQ